MMMADENYLIVEYIHELSKKGRMVLSDEFYDGETNKRINEWCVTVVSDISGKVVIAHNPDLLECLHMALTDLGK